MVRADERALAASGVACLERCLPLLGDASAGPEALRPLWAGLANGKAHWAIRLAEARELLKGPPERDTGAPDDDGFDAADAVRAMLDTAPAEWAAAPLRAWAGDCSVTALALHRRLGAGPLHDPGTPATDPLSTGELRRQIRMLKLLAAGEGPSGLRQALNAATEGRRVLSAALSRRARGTGRP
ncbi:hypothetical protein [Streptomyces qinzhouensis]|uniref:Uncharacterized protein n=1 Tax=Streptomyces qinzhouensis TaxID=2599401 RepID=A0A5B8IJ99_9ACTN|nr:hypothetical protein [Streptomyces qinzhouensis]QDY78648.1 hypothetical protein FQU76_21430 [Streptomyces qinzhouensis]